MFVKTNKTSECSSCVAPCLSSLILQEQCHLLITHVDEIGKGCEFRAQGSGQARLEHSGKSLCSGQYDDKL